MRHLTATHPPASNAPRRRRVLGVLLSAAVGMGFFVARAAAQQFVEQPKADTSWYSSLLVGVAGAFGFLLQLLIYVVGYLTVVLTKIFIWAVTYSDFIYNGTVTIGWEIVRDFSNVFFVVAILTIAWATILQIEAYGYRRLLPKLVLMAVLINFSKLITGVIIDLGQIVILTFAQASVGGLNVQGLFAKLGVGDLTKFRGGPILESDLGGQAFSLLGTLLFGFILLLIIFGVILAYTVIFTFRIVALWILIILSPLAFLLAAFPAGQSYSRQWWSSLSKYVTTGVVIMFFFWLALVTSERAFSIISPELAQQQGTTSLGVAGSKMGEPINLSRFIITVSFLIAGLVAAQKAGVAGSSFAGDLLNRGRRAITSTGRWLASRPTSLGGWAARKIKAGQVPFTKVTTDEHGKVTMTGLGGLVRGLDLNPMNLIRGFKDSRAAQREREEAVGRLYSGEALHRGRLGGISKGIGAGRDFFDAYARGTFYGPGLLRMGKAIIGGEKATEKIFGERDAVEAKIKEHTEEAARKRESAGKRDFIKEGVDAYVVDKLQDTIDAIALDRNANPSGSKSKNYRDEYLKTLGIEDKDERKRLSDLDPADLVFQTYFDGEGFKKFAKEKDEQLARARLKAEAEAWAADETKTAERTNLDRLGRKQVEDDIEKREREVARMQAGGLSDADAETNQKKLDQLRKELEQIDKDIVAAGAAGAPRAELDRRRAALDEEIGKIALTGAAGTHELRTQATEFSASDQRRNRVRYSEFGADKTEADSLRALRIRGLNEQQRLLAATKLTGDDRQELLRQAEAQEEQVKRLKQQSFGLKQRAEYWEAPKAFYADEGYQGLIREKMGKIHALNSDELVSAFKSSLRDQDSITGGAIAMKLARDSNDNELWDAFGFATNAQGKHDFFDAVMIGKKNVKMGDGQVYHGPSFKMSEQQAFGVENAIDYINEDVNHWETARTMKMEGGLFKRMKEEEHALAALAEIMKKNPREVARSFNRLAYGGELTNRDTGEREFTPSMLGKAIVMGLGPEILKNILRGEFNKNAALHMGTWMEKAGGTAELRRNQVDEQFIRQLAALYRKESASGTTKAADIIRKLFQGLV